MSNLLYLDQPGLALCVSRGRLIVKDGAGGEQTFPSSSSLRVVILASAGYVTTEALAWLSREHVAVFVAHAGEFMTLADCASGRLARRELALRRRQLECVLNPDLRLAAARSLITLKLSTLNLPSETHHAALAALASAPTLQDVMNI
jgi:CRISPR/Cas system-associated endonuclease Cas1